MSFAVLRRLLTELIHMNCRKCIPFVLLVVISSSSGCRPDDLSRGGKKADDIQKVVMGDVRIGKESTEFYIAYGSDAAILGFATLPGTGSVRYFPMYASTHRGIPPVVLDIFVSKSEAEMWVRSSWSGGEILAYHRVGADKAITQFGNVTFLSEPMPRYLSGGPVPFPELNMGSVVRKASFKHD